MAKSSKKQNESKQPTPGQFSLIENKESDKACKPFVKWAGGKSQLLHELSKRMPATYFRYYEPFIGGGALFFRLRPQRGYISDMNPELVNTYRVVKSKVAALIEDLKQHRYDKDYYYEVRDIDRSEEFKSWSNVQRASRFIFLNKTCFNGLMRVNKKGQFNTPFGKYKNPKILDEQNLRACNRALKNTKINQASFLKVEDFANRGDFVYFDPPYVPLSDTANFTTFSKDGFSVEDQQALVELCQRLDARGVKFMLSNSATDETEKLYKGFNVERVAALRAINSKGSKRGPVDELIVRNYE